MKGLLALAASSLLAITAGFTSWFHSNTPEPMFVEEAALVQQQLSNTTHYAKSQFDAERAEEAQSAAIVLSLIPLLFSLTAGVVTAWSAMLFFYYVTICGYNRWKLGSTQQNMCEGHRRSMYLVALLSAVNIPLLFVYRLEMMEWMDAMVMWNMSALVILWYITNCTVALHKRVYYSFA